MYVISPFNVLHALESLADALHTSHEESLLTLRCLIEMTACFCELWCSVMDHLQGNSITVASNAVGTSEWAGCTPHSLSVQRLFGHSQSTRIAL